MMSKYIKSELNNKNEFRVKTEFTMFNTLIKSSQLKIDTGCGYTVFPVKRLGIFLDEDILNFKKKDILNNTRYMLGYGVETGGIPHDIPITLEEKMRCPAMNFIKPIQSFSICGIKIATNQVRVNYDRSGNMLLGMDILKDWDIHIGTITIPNLEETGKTIFLACPNDNITPEYLMELERLFGR